MAALFKNYPLLQFGTYFKNVFFSFKNKTLRLIKYYKNICNEHTLVYLLDR